MDSFFLRFARRLMVLLVVCFAALFMQPRDAQAATSGTYSAAMAACQARYVTAPGYVGLGYTCVNVGSVASLGPNSCYVFAYAPSGGNNINSYGYVCSSVGTPCSGLSPSTWYMQGEVLNGQKISIPASDPTTGLMANCSFTATDIGVPTFLYGKWRTYVTWSSDGNPAGGSGTVGQVTNPNGSVPSTAPAPVNSASPPPATAPAQCTVGTCYNQSTDTYTYTDGSGNAVSVPGSVARSSSGQCSSGASSTMCAGSPSPPLPGSPITDPATQIQSSDSYVQANPSTGATQSVATTVYGLPGTKQTSGQKTGDVGPASSSSTGNSDSFSGGGDCNSPPVCSGDAATCGIARETWTAMCTAKSSADSLQKVFVGDGTQTPTLAPLHAASDLDGQTVDLGDTSGADSSGMGWSTTCPLQDLTITVVGVSVPLSFKPVCDYGAWMRAFVMLLASIGYAGIMGGFKVGSIFGGGGGSD